MIQGVDPSIMGGGDPPLSDQEILARRHCYCPKDAPAGHHCGDCMVCKKPGHVCHYPGPLPFTGSWCDQHYLHEVRERPHLMQVRERRKNRPQ